MPRRLKGRRVREAVDLILCVMMVAAVVVAAVALAQLVADLRPAGLPRSPATMLP